MPSLAEMIYGTAQNAAQNSGQGIAEGMKTGAELAMRKRQLDIAQQQVNAHMAQIEQAKAARGLQTFDNTMKLPANLRAAALAKDGPATLALSGLGINIPDHFRKVVSSDDELAGKVTSRIMQYNDDVAAGKNPSAKDAIADVQNIYALNELTPSGPAYDAAVKQLDVASKEAAGNKVKKDIASSNQANQIEVAKIKAKGDLQKHGQQMALEREIRNKFAPLDKDTAAMGAALAARDRIDASLKKDPTGMSASRADMGGMVYNFLHTDLGRVNHTELSDIFGIPGIEGQTEQFITNHITGGITPKLFNMVKERLDSAALEHQSRIDRLRSSFEATNSKDELGSMYPFTAPSIRSIGGHNISRPQAQAFIKAKPTSPMAAQMRKMFEFDNGVSGGTGGTGGVSDEEGEE